MSWSNNRKIPVCCSRMSNRKRIEKCCPCRIAINKCFNSTLKPLYCYMIRSNVWCWITVSLLPGFIMFKGYDRRSTIVVPYQHYAVTAGNIRNIRRIRIADYPKSSQPKIAGFSGTNKVNIMGKIPEISRAIIFIYWCYFLPAHCNYGCLGTSNRYIAAWINFGKFR